MEAPLPQCWRGVSPDDGLSKPKATQEHTVCIVLDNKFYRIFASPGTLAPRRRKRLANSRAVGSRRRIRPAHTLRARPGPGSRGRTCSVVTCAARCLLAAGA